MTDDLRESVSALMDDEANELEMHRVLKSIESSDDLRSTWRRYQIASFALKRQLHNHSQFDISARVAESIASEEIEIDSSFNTDASLWNKVSKPITSLAVAASVAFLVVFGVLQINQTGIDGAQTELANQSSTVPGMPVTGVQIVASQAVNADEAITPSQKRLREWMSKHFQQAGLSRGSGVMPYAQLVDMEKSQK